MAVYSPIQGHWQLWIHENCLFLQAANLEPAVLKYMIKIGNHPNHKKFCPKIDTDRSLETLGAHNQQNCTCMMLQKINSEIMQPWPSSSESSDCVTYVNLLNSYCIVFRTLKTWRRLSGNNNKPDAPAAFTAFEKASIPQFRIGL